MSDVGRYRKAYPRIWRHPGFRALSRDEQRLALYLLHGPQTNRIGLYHFSVFTAAEDLDTTPETLKKCLANVTVTFGWMFDSDARVLFIPSWWKWNTPENANVIKGALKDLNDVPPCSLVDAFAANVGAITEVVDRSGVSLLETFLKGLSQRLRKGSSTQEQEHFSTGTKQKRAALRAVAVVKEKHHDDEKNVQPDDRIVTIARDARRDTPSESNDYLVEVVLEQCRRQQIDANRKAAIVALAVCHEAMTA